MLMCSNNVHAKCFELLPSVRAHTEVICHDSDTKYVCTIMSLVVPYMGHSEMCWDVSIPPNCIVTLAISSWIPRVSNGRNYKMTVTMLRGASIMVLPFLQSPFFSLPCVRLKVRKHEIFGPLPSHDRLIKPWWLTTFVKTHKRPSFSNTLSPAHSYRIVWKPVFNQLYVG